MFIGESPVFHCPLCPRHSGVVLFEEASGTVEALLPKLPCEGNGDLPSIDDPSILAAGHNGSLGHAEDRGDNMEDDIKSPVAGFPI